ncbi:MAG: DUF433 domain-containing protein [Elusimicrobiota bacterium]
MQQVLTKEKPTEHPYIVRNSKICGGEPIIKGTRTTVRSIIGYYKMGLSIEDILAGLPHLNPAQVHDAISYYHMHLQEIERYIKENSEEYCKKKYPPNLINKTRARI